MPERSAIRVDAAEHAKIRQQIQVGGDAFAVAAPAAERLGDLLQGPQAGRRGDHGAEGAELVLEVFGPGLRFDASS